MTGWEPGAPFRTFKRPCNCVWHSRLPDDENYSASKSCYLEQQRHHEKWTRRRTPLVVLGTPHLSFVISVVRRANFSHLRLGRAAGFLDPIPERQGNLGTLLLRIPVARAAGTLWIASPSEWLVPQEEESLPLVVAFPAQVAESWLGDLKVLGSASADDPCRGQCSCVRCTLLVFCLFSSLLFYFYANISGFIHKSCVNRILQVVKISIQKLRTVSDCQNLVWSLTAQAVWCGLPLGSNTV